MAVFLGHRFLAPWEGWGLRRAEEALEQESWPPGLREGLLLPNRRRFLWANMKLGPCQVIGYTIVFPRFCIPASVPMVNWYNGR